MFTIRFVDENKSYRSYSVCRYEVAPDSDTVPTAFEVIMSRKLNGAHEFSEWVGVDAAEVAYVSNCEGKTIDVVRRPR